MPPSAVRPLLWGGSVRLWSRVQLKRGPLVSYLLDEFDDERQWLRPPPRRRRRLLLALPLVATLTVVSLALGGRADDPGPPRGPGPPPGPPPTSERLRPDAGRCRPGVALPSPTSWAPSAPGSGQTDRSTRSSPRGQAAPRHQGPRPARLPVHPRQGPGLGPLTCAPDPSRAGAGDPTGRAGPVRRLGRVDAPRRLR